MGLPVWVSVLVGITGATITLILLFVIGVAWVWAGQMDQFNKYPPYKTQT